MNEHDLRRQLLGKKSPDVIVMMESLSAEYGWTPNQIKEQAVQDVYNYWQILTLKKEIENNNTKKSNGIK